METFLSYCTINLSIRWLRSPSATSIPYLFNNLEAIQVVKLKIWVQIFLCKREIKVPKW